MVRKNSVDDSGEQGMTRELDHNQHSVYLMYYHLIMVVKYRRKVIEVIRKYIESQGKKR